MLKCEFNQNKCNFDHQTLSICQHRLEGCWPDFSNVGFAKLSKVEGNEVSEKLEIRLGT